MGEQIRIQAEPKAEASLHYLNAGTKLAIFYLLNKRSLANQRIHFNPTSEVETKVVFYSYGFNASCVVAPILVCLPSVFWKGHISTAANAMRMKQVTKAITTVVNMYMRGPVTRNR